MCLPWTLFGSGDNAPHLVQPTASCLISHADEKIKTISSLLTSIVLSWCGFFFFRPINKKFNASSQLVQQIKSLLSTSQHRELFLQKNHQSRSFFLLSLRDKLLWGDQSDLAVVQRKSSWLHFASRQWMEVSFSILQMNCRGLLEPVLWLFPSCLRTVTSTRSVFAGRIVKLLVQ